MAKNSPRSPRGRSRLGGGSLEQALRLRNSETRAKGRRDLPRAWGDIPQPIRLDIWTGRSLQDAGRELASTPRPDLAEAPARPIARLKDNQAAIRRNYLDTVAAEERGDTITPAA